MFCPLLPRPRPRPRTVCAGPEEDVQLEIFLVNGKKVTIDIMSTDQTNDVLETTINMIGVRNG